MKSHRSSLKIKDLHRVDRPREKLLAYGPEKLQQYELLAIILRSGTRSLSALELSKVLLQSLDGSFTEASIEKLTKVSGIGVAKACEIIASIELGRRLFSSAPLPFLSPKDVWQRVHDIAHQKKEHFVALYLDARKQEIAREIISVGTLDESLVHPREVFEPAIRHVAASIILVHNHPSGSTEPSNEDIDVTYRLQDAGELLGISILDHIIVTRDNWYSMQEAGTL